MEMAAEHTSRLEYLKDCAECWHKYFRENNQRYHDFVKFVFSTSLSSQDRSTLDYLKKPDVEFNILECIINRILGDFAQQEPGIVVRADDGIPVDNLTPQLLEMMNLLEAHLPQTMASRPKHLRSRWPEVLRLLRFMWTGLTNCHLKRKS
jgi:hypothetical protein